jgi:hypothetical protein
MNEMHAGVHLLTPVRPREAPCVLLGVVGMIQERGDEIRRGTGTQKAGKLIAVLPGRPRCKPRSLTKAAPQMELRRAQPRSWAAAQAGRKGASGTMTKRVRVVLYVFDNPLKSNLST